MKLMWILGIPENDFQAPSLLYHILTRPIQFTITHIHTLLVWLRKSPEPPTKNSIKVVCISDTHTFIPTIPEGDVLIHAGDLTNLGTVTEIQHQLDWLDKLPHQHIIVIAGNHDSFFDPRSRRPEDVNKELDFKRINYLQHSSIAIDFPSKGDRCLKFYGAPQIPECGGPEHAFQYRRQDDAWTETVPDDTDVLITHTPPRWHLDLPWGMGCDFLLTETWRVKPSVHIFGHVHAGRGKEVVYWDKAQEAYEKVMATQSLTQCFDPEYGLNCLEVVLQGFLGIVWTRIWGAEPGSTVMVNSALVDAYGMLKNSPQIVEI